MPTVVRCGICGAILLHSEDLPAGYENWYLEFFRRFGGHCPDCKRKLPSPTTLKEVIQIEVKPNPTTLNKSPLAATFQYDYHRRG